MHVCVCVCVFGSGRVKGLLFPTPFNLTQFAIQFRESALIWLLIETSGGLLWTRYWTSHFYKMLEIYWLAAELKASQKGPCFVELEEVWSLVLCVLKHHRDLAPCCIGLFVYSYKIPSTLAMPACPVGSKIRHPLSVPSVGLKLWWQAVRSHIMCHRGQE